MVDVSLPTSLERRQILFRSHRMICGGSVEQIRYILYIDPNDTIAWIERRKNPWDVWWDKSIATRRLR